MLHVYLRDCKFECYILRFHVKEHKSQGPGSDSQLVCISPPANTLIIYKHSQTLLNPRPSIFISGLLEHVSKALLDAA